MNTQYNFRQMVNAAVQRRLEELAEKEADRIVTSQVRRHGSGETVPVASTPPRKRIRDRGSLRHQFAPKDSWLSLGRVPARTKALTGQLDAAMKVAQAALASGPAARVDLTKLMVEGNKGWTRVTASGCISRLVAMGRLSVVDRPAAPAPRSHH